MNESTGFTLIELLIVVAIVGILTSIALPSYQGFTVRARIIEGLSLTGAAKQGIQEGAATLVDLDIAATTWNQQANNLGAMSKYVDSVLFNPPPNTTGMITITYNAGTVGLGAGQNTLILMPYMRTGVPGNQPTLSNAIGLGSIGPIEWACSSSSNNVATSQNMPAPLGTVLPQFVPASCR